MNRGLLMPQSDAPQRTPLQDSGSAGTMTTATTPRTSLRRWMFCRESTWWLLLLAVLGTQFWFPRFSSVAINDTYSVELGGQNAYFQLMQRRFPNADRTVVPIWRSTAALLFGPSKGTLCLIGPARNPDDSEWAELLTFVDEGGRLIIAARRDRPNLVILESHLNVVPVADSNAARNRLPGMPQNAWKDGVEQAGLQMARIEPVIPRADDIGAIPWKSNGKISFNPDEALPLVVTGDTVQAVWMRYGSGDIIALASDYVFSNELLLSNPQAAAFGLELLALPSDESVKRDRNSPVRFDEYLNFSGEAQSVGVLLQDELRPLTLQAVLMLVLLGWSGTRRFGGLLPELVTPRHNITDHSDALGNWYFRTQHSAGALRSYLDQLRLDLKLTGSALQQKRSVSAIAARLKTPVEDLETLLKSAELAAEDKTLKRRAAAVFIRRLSELRRKTL